MTVLNDRKFDYLYGKKPFSFIIQWEPTHLPLRLI